VDFPLPPFWPATVNTDIWPSHKIKRPSVRTLERQYHRFFELSSSRIIET
jgi:hypothetical protein